MEISLPAPRRLALTGAAAWRVALGSLVVVSALVRVAAAWLRATPNYFPDEYIYTALSRSLAHDGRPLIRGHVAHFPALLQPLVTAPAWLAGSLETGYRVAQAIESVAVSLTALAVWWVARRLGVSRRLAFVAAALSVAAPEVGYSGWMLAEPVAYPLFVFAVGAGTVALARPSARAQLVFLGVAGLAAFARIQLAILPLAFIAAALVLRELRRQRIVVAAMGLALVAVAAVGLGYYRHPVLTLAGRPAELGRNLLVVAYASGWILVPAALLGLAAALVRPRTREERAFGAFAVVALVGVLGEATLYGDTSVVHERYACYAVPLVALGFALHAGRGWPWRRAHAAVAGLMLLAAAAVPMSGWAAAGGNAHSLFLTALLRVEELAGGAGSGSLLVAALAGALAILAAALPRTVVVATLAVGACIATSALATSFDVRNSRNVRAYFLAAGPQWVDRAHVGSVTMVLGPIASRTNATEQLFWNRTVDRVAPLPGAAPLDSFAVVRDPHGPVLFDEDGVARVPRDPVATNGSWVLARTPRLDAIVTGRYGDGWLAPSGTIQAFRTGVIRLGLTAPGPLTLIVGARRVSFRAGQTRTLILPVRSLPWRTTYRASSFGYAGMRPVSARATFPAFATARSRVSAPGASGGGRIRTSVG